MSTPASLNVVLAEDNPHDVALVRMSLNDAGLNCELGVLADGDGSTNRTAQTPFIAMTGSDAPRAYESAQKNAAVQYFRKPLNFAEYMRLGTIVRDLFFLRKNARCEISDFPLKEGAGS